MLTRSGTRLLGRMRRDTKNSPSRGQPGGDSSEGYSSGGLRYHRTRPLERELGFGERGHGKGLAVGAEDSAVWGTSLFGYGGYVCVDMGVSLWKSAWYAAGR